MSLTEAALGAPLAEILRPKTLDEVVGQAPLLGQGGRLRLMLAHGSLGSIIFWGPPVPVKQQLRGCWQMRLIWRLNQYPRYLTGLRICARFLIVAQRRRQGRRTLLFVDEVHRFNKAQQDGLLPRVEDGTVTLVGATTENPSFALNGALLSRAQVLVLDRLDRAALEAILSRLEAHIGRDLPVDSEARAALLGMADGDGRYLLNMASLLVEIPGTTKLDSRGLAELFAGAHQPLIGQGTNIII